MADLGLEFDIVESPKVYGIKMSKMTKSPEIPHKPRGKKLVASSFPVSVSHVVVTVT